MRHAICLVTLKFEVVIFSRNLVLYAVILLRMMSSFAIGIAVTKFCRPYLLTYVTGSTDYINAVFADVSAI